MKSVNSASLTPAVTDWLANSYQPRILHIFDHVYNLINENKEVLSVVTPQIGNGPFNLVLEDDICFPEQLNIESPVLIVPAQLALGDLIINTANAKLWDSRPDWESLHTERNIISNQLPVINYEPLLPQPLISNLSSALASTDLSSAKTITSQLAGLGIGLTPSGDDFMMGALYAVWIIHPPEAAAAIAEEIANTAAPLTTSLSAAWLWSAANGQAGIVWHQFFDALMSSDEGSIQRALDKILCVGQTSGADAMSGFLRTMMTWIENRSPI